jgi:hypothetical protein
MYIVIMGKKGRIIEQIGFMYAENAYRTAKALRKKGFQARVVHRP